MRKSVRVKPLRVWPKLRIAMGEVRAKHHVRVLRDPVIANLIVGEHTAHQHPNRRVETYRLLDDLTGVRKFRQVFDRGCTLAEHSRQLGSERADHGWVLGEEQPGPA